jgi:hypothetical protein
VSASAGGGSIVFGCENQGNLGTPSGSPTSQFSNATYNSVGQWGRCTASASAYAYLGVVGARASASHNAIAPEGGGVSAQASAGWSDALQPTIAGRFQLAQGITSFRFDYNVGATGGVSTSASDPSANGVASIFYQLSVAGSALSGQMTRTGNVTTTRPETGGFGTLSGSFVLGAAESSPGVYVIAGTYGFSLAGGATAASGQDYFPGRVFTASASADADFGSTLAWQGISRVRAFDASGSEVALPADFRVALTGRETGFDYWDAAPVLAATVPEPATWATLAAGLAAVGAVARRRRVRR